MDILSDRERILIILQKGDFEIAGQFTWGSNFTFLVDIELDGQKLAGVYKPVRGERPLWDFPRHSLALREVAAYLTSEVLGLGMVPPTVLRAEGPAGPGSLQLYVDADPELHYYTFSDEDKERLRPVAMFDALINNADRKSGHILLAPDGHLWLIDHGLCFHAQDKLRTVVWDFVGEPIPEALLQTLQSFCARLSNPAFREALAEVLNEAELVALARRAERLIQQARFPEPGPGRPYPWPLV